MSCETEFRVLTALLFELIQFKAGELLTKDNAWQNDAQVLSGKLFKHMLSAMDIYTGGKFVSRKGFELDYVDYSSISIVIRAALENYLVIYWLYLDADEDVSRYRHKTWELGGLMDRSKMFASDPVSKAKLKAEAGLIEVLKGEISANDHFVGMKQWGQDKVLKGEWRTGKSWADFAVMAGIHRTYFNDIYRHLCGHSHASYISALQVRDASSLDVQVELSEGILQIGCLIMAHFAFSYSYKFLKSEDVLKKDDATYDVAHKWRVGIEDQNHFYGVGG
ncbi:TPA: hypothetical protein SMR42_000133 [Pseudomonas putida]|nr:hypothetical protein [Pseudomonas putida]